MNRKERRTLLASLEEQGAEVKHTKSGVRVLFPNGSTTAFHYTPSDNRSDKNLRGDVRRAGLIWPFDDERRTGMGLSAQEKREITLEKLFRGLEQLGDSFTVREASTASGVSVATVSRVLPLLEGFTGEAANRPNGPRLWHKPGTVAEEPQAEVPVAEPVAVAEPEEPEEDTRIPLDITYERFDTTDDEQFFPVSADTSEPQPVGYVDQDEQEVDHREEGLEKSPGEPEEHERPRPEREFIDTHDSWVLDENEVPADLRVMAYRMGLEIEVRVWRKHS